MQGAGSQGASERRGILRSWQGVSRDSAEFGAMEEGLISSGGRNLRLPPISDSARTQKSPDTPGSPEGNTEGPGTASSEPLLPS